MSLKGIDLRLLIGKNEPEKAPPELLEALDSVEVTHSDKERSGFRITFRAGRSKEKSKADYILYKNPLLSPCNRVIIAVVFGPVPRVLMDGIITNQQLSSGAEPGSSTLTIIGEDVSLAMDIKELPQQYDGQDDATIASTVIGKYSKFGLVPDIVKPPASNPPDPKVRTPSKNMTDLKYLEKLAKYYGYVFYINPGPIPKMNAAYWGPPKRGGVPQRMLTANMGHESNVSSINFQYNALTPFVFEGTMIDAATNKAVDISEKTSSRPALSGNPALSAQPKVRVKYYGVTKGLDAAQAMAKAKGQVDAASDAVTAEGELDSLRYGDVLLARMTVKLGGAGNNFNGTYYVKSVTHNIKKGEYKQHFTLVREGVGAKS